MKDLFKKLLEQAERENSKYKKDINLPQEIKLREARLAKISEIKQEIEERAQARFEQEQAEYEAKMAARAAKEAARGRKLGGRKPKRGPRDQEQVNLTDGDSRIMPKSGGDFVQGYNAQATYDVDTMLVTGSHISQQTNDKQEVEPALAELNRLPSVLGKVKRAALDNGYFSADNVEKIIQQDIEPYIASGRESHNQSLDERFAKLPKVPENANPVELMQHRLKTEEGKKFYAKRKSTVEPVFGIIKEIMEFRHFMLRGLDAVKGEWSLVCIAYNLKRLCVLNI